MTLERKKIINVGVSSVRPLDTVPSARIGVSSRRSTEVPIHLLQGYKRVQPDGYVAQPGHLQHGKESLSFLTSGSPSRNSDLSASPVSPFFKALESQVKPTSPFNTQSAPVSPIMIVPSSAYVGSTSRPLMATPTKLEHPPSDTWQYKGQQQQQQTAVERILAPAERVLALEQGLRKIQVRRLRAHVCFGVLVTFWRHS